MSQWRVDPAVLQPYLPRGLEIDTFDGAAFVSLVGLQFFNTKLLGVAVPFHSNFVEVNLRFYVRRVLPGEVRRGVVFIKELVPRFWIALVAKLFYNEQYSAVPMTHECEIGGRGTRWTYGWRRGGKAHAVSASAAGEPHPLAEGSREQFIAEHYWGYTRQRNGETVEYRVRHPSWRIWSSADVVFDWDASATYGGMWGEILRRHPDFSFIAEGSDITVSWGERVRP